MKAITPIIRNGRWLVLCPKHKELGAMLAETEYICPVCYPKSIAVITVVKNGQLQIVPDKNARRTARILAQENGELYTVEYPKDKEKIEKALEALPETDRVWHGETLRDTKDAVKQKAHIIKNFEKRDKSLDGRDGDWVIERRR